MRQPQPRPYLIIIPPHVEHGLATLAPSTAAWFRRELAAAAALPELEFSARRRVVLHRGGAKLEYEIDPDNRALIVMDARDAAG